MNIATVVLTSERPQETLTRTLASLHAAGWPPDQGAGGGIGIYDDRQQSGHFAAYMAALDHAVQRDPRADAYFIVEDDVVFCGGLRAYLQRTLWPGAGEEIALCSPYAPEAYRQDAQGWDHTQSHRGHYLAGSQAWIFPPLAAWAILAEVAPLRTVHNADWEIGKWAAATGQRIWYHTPSLAQHIGIGNSALGDDQATTIRIAADFVGEDYDALALLTRNANEAGPMQ